MARILTQLVVLALLSLIPLSLKRLFFSFTYLFLHRLLFVMITPLFSLSLSLCTALLSLFVLTLTRVTSSSPLARQRSCVRVPISPLFLTPRVFRLLSRPLRSLLLLVSSHSFDSFLYDIFGFTISQFSFLVTDISRCL